MKKTCIKCNSNFIVDEDDQSFYEKMKVPVPNVCPDCRFMMRGLYRNEVSLYSNQVCALCKNNMVTMYNPKSSYVVYCSDCYSGDGWDSKEYAMEYDYSRTFFSQLGELVKKVPKMNLYVTYANGPIVDSPFNNGFGGAKNCYFLFNGGPAENTMYSRGVKDCKDLLDSYFSTNIENSYEVINTHHSSNIFYSQNVTNSNNCYFSRNCSGCMDCFGCVNLRNKRHCWFNEQITKEEYQIKLDQVLGSYRNIESMKDTFDSFKITQPHRENNNIKTVDCQGDYLSECKEVKNSLEVAKSENCKDIFSSKQIKNSIGVFGYGFGAEYLLETVSTGHSSNVIGSYGIDQSMDIEYSFSCFPSNKNLIGCDSLKNSSYCILNKQYTKEEYEKLREHIVKELISINAYGLMMPPELAPFAYNETIAQDNFPLTKEEALAQGFRWEDDIQMTKGKETMLTENIPDHIKDVQDLIIAEVLKCKSCERNYKITGQELHFYRKMNLPIPRKCFYCRHQDRIVRRGPYKFWERNCAHCNKTITTNYSPDRPEIIYCEQCYQQEVI